MRIRFSEYIAIHAVASDWSTYAPSAIGTLRSNSAMLSSPRKPPWKMLLPSMSSRLTHHVKFSVSLWNTRSRNTTSPTPERCLSIS